jgi:hypothetical protein
MMFAPKNKYHAKKVTIYGIDFDSKKEGMRYLLLKDMERQGEISGLQLQVSFELLPAIYKDEVVHLKTKDKVERRLVQRAVHYVADFVYTDKEGKQHVEDTKGLRLPDYILKKKMMLAYKGITIVEV